MICMIGFLFCNRCNDLYDSLEYDLYDKIGMPAKKHEIDQLISIALT
jgi:hypothetical protein